MSGVDSNPGHQGRRSGIPVYEMLGDTGDGCASRTCAVLMGCGRALRKDLPLSRHSRPAAGRR